MWCCWICSSPSSPPSSRRSKPIQRRSQFPSFLKNCVDQVWKWEMYKLVEEYDARPGLAPLHDYHPSLWRLLSSSSSSRWRLTLLSTIWQPPIRLVCKGRYHRGQLVQISTLKITYKNVKNSRNQMVYMPTGSKSIISGLAPPLVIIEDIWKLLKAIWKRTCRSAHMRTNGGVGSLLFL